MEEIIQNHIDRALAYLCCTEGDRLEYLRIAQRELMSAIAHMEQLAERVEQ